MAFKSEGEVLDYFRMSEIWKNETKARPDLRNTVLSATAKTVEGLPGWEIMIRTPNKESKYFMSPVGEIAQIELSLMTAGRIRNRLQSPLPTEFGKEMKNGDQNA